MGGPWRRDYCRAGGGWYFLWVGEARLRAYLRERTVQLLAVALWQSGEASDQAYGLSLPSAVR